MTRVGLALMLLSWVAAAQSDPADKATFEKVCGACHATGMIADLKTESEWIETVNNMKAVGAKGSDAQFDAVMRYLARNFSKVNVNTATPEQIAPALDVGDAIARAIVEFRNSRGDFKTLEDLRKVPGLDGAKIEGRKSRIAFR